MRSIRNKFFSTKGITSPTSILFISPIGATAYFSSSSSLIILFLSIQQIITPILCFLIPPPPLPTPSDMPSGILSKYFAKSPNLRDSINHSNQHFLSIRSYFQKEQKLHPNCSIIKKRSTLLDDETTAWDKDLFWREDDEQYFPMNLSSAAKLLKGSEANAVRSGGNQNHLIKLVAELESEAAAKKTPSSKPHSPQSQIELLATLMKVFTREESDEGLKKLNKTKLNPQQMKPRDWGRTDPENNPFEIPQEGNEKRANGTRNNGQEESSKNFPIYIFQGHYMAEPRLNDFVDGALKNMAIEIKESKMDPLYFRVLPRGKVGPRVSKDEISGNGIKPKKKNKGHWGKSAWFGLRWFNFNSLFRRRRGHPEPEVVQKSRKLMGGGRIDGLSTVKRDGDAEMQQYGNYTLIRSHMKYGPLELSMRFFTKMGEKRAFATIPILRAHSVARVNMDGSEMIDYIIDRPYPETIKIRGMLPILAQRIGQNIFSRLFLQDSFVVSSLREKAGLAFLSENTNSTSNYSYINPRIKFKLTSN